MRIGSVLVLVWLLIGVLACAQRGYFGNGDYSCAEAGTIAATVAAGPLNYVGLNPRIDRCPEINEDSVPQPSK